MLRGIYCWSWSGARIVLLESSFDTTEGALECGRDCAENCSHMFTRFAAGPLPYSPAPLPSYAEGGAELVLMDLPPSMRLAADRSRNLALESGGRSADRLDSNAPAV